MYTTQQLEIILQCAQNFEYFCTNYIEVISSIGIKPFILYSHQKTLVDNINKHKLVSVEYEDRMLGISTLMAAYILHKAIFESGQTILIASNNLRSAQHILYIMVDMLHTLPTDMTPIIKQKTRTRLHFENDSLINIVSHGRETLMGRNFDLLFIDNANYTTDKDQTDVHHSIVSHQTKKPQVITTECSFTGNGSSVYVRSPLFLDVYVKDLRYGSSKQ